MQVLFLQGFMACRASAEKIIEVVTMMQGSKFPCMKSPATVERLRQRFFLENSDTEVCAAD
jgi:hypothetical protein